MRALPACFLLVTGWSYAQAPAPGADAVATGIWRGDSVCATDSPACHNEKVVFYITNVTDKPGVVFVRAEKIVEGKPVPMGAGEWQYDRTKHTLMMQAEMRTWLLTIDGGRIEGVLTLPDSTVLRRLTLRKDE